MDLPGAGAQHLLVRNVRPSAWLLASDALAIADGCFRSAVVNWTQNRFEMHVGPPKPPSTVSVEDSFRGPA